MRGPALGLLVAGCVSHLAGTWTLGLTAAVLLTTGCAGGGAAEPIVIDLGRDVCSHCRMAIVSTATAAEIIAPGEEPRLFDDLGCLRDFIADARAAADAVVFVTDHRSGAWVEARHAVFTKTLLETPMASGLVAHTDAASRDRDAAASGGEAVSTGSILR